MIVTPTLDMAEDESSLGEGTTRLATPPLITEQPSKNITRSHTTTISSCQAPNPGYCSHDDHPGVPYELIISTLSSYFDSLWASNHEPKEDDYDMPLIYEDFESAFDLGDIVRIQSDTTNAWAEYIPGLDGYYSKQAFKIIGKSLKTGPWWFNKLDPHETETRAFYFHDDEGTFVQVDGVDSHILSLLRSSEPEPEPEDESETERKSWENDCWMYKLEQVEPQSFPVADVMLWKEENLMLDAEAMGDGDDGDDGDDDDDDDDDHSDDLRREVGDEGEMTSHSKTETVRFAKNCERLVVM
ncbi:hypothetical protein LTR96_004239 [Exophiala xenobiotica]|nr:hypothetical protein LTR96_004239 [Exophiala xenobiotica]KAK5339852.1 hypothetical protein LTR98_004654 [Exophiala xenobiotica]KAK5415504.1 hypothetical protein LTR06_003554 [Exophiala xenobiotica]KAK5558270.1 hypothetical protein LTR46_003519 [Exophiala xenobiotica]